jgi:hypothetical protein
VHQNASPTLQRIAKHFESEGSIVLWPDIQTRPDLLVLEKSGHVLVFDCYGGDERIIDARKKLNHKVQLLRSVEESEVSGSIYRVLINLTDEPDQTLSTSSSLMSESAIISEGGLNEQLKVEPPKLLADSITRQYSPVTLFTSKVNTGMRDDGKDGRDELRFRLNEQQSDAALVENADVLRVSGPPGSGKTLVLVARARWMASQHSSWRIVIVCFNKGLVPYISNMVVDHPSIEVMTFNRFGGQSGARFSYNDEAAAAKAYARAKLAGIGPVCDALFIDEWQDFCPSWIDFCFDVVRDGCGGISLAGDAAQAIYQHSEPARSLIGKNVVNVTLTRPYRSTRQILQFTQALHLDFATSGMEDAPDGEPVDLVYADDWNAQADAAVWEVEKILSQGQWPASQVAVLATRKSLVSRIEDRLNSKEIDFSMSTVEDVGAESDPSGHILLSTVHAAKGLEFGVVILVGLDAIERKESDPDNGQKMRIGYVGPTRARDRLIALYSKSTSLIDRVRDTPTLELRRWNFPDDFEGAR